MSYFVQTDGHGEANGRFWQYSKTRLKTSNVNIVPVKLNRLKHNGWCSYREV